MVDPQVPSCAVLVQRGDVGVAAHFAFNFTVPHPDANLNHERHVEHIDRILDFAQQTTSPIYPGQLNPANVEYGQAPLADGTSLGCAGCHGSYTKIGDDYATPGGWMVDYRDSDLLDVGTDGRYSEILQSFTAIAQHGNGLADYFAALGKPELAPQTNIPAKFGYLAPPLVGVWASAPYFHNGSVATLRQVLDSSSRPTLWSRPNKDPFVYDFIEVGMAYTVPSYLRRFDDGGGALRHDRLPQEPRRSGHAPDTGTLIHDSGIDARRPRLARS